MTSRRPRLVLTGPPASGKTTIGRALAHAWDLPFADADSEIEKDAGATVPEIFAGRGEPGFREIEAATVTRLLEEFDGVLALGGGAVTTESVRRALRGHTVVFVDADVPTSVERLAAGGVRPLLTGDPEARLRALHAERRPLYEEVSLARVDTSGLDPQAVAGRIARLVEDHDRARAERRSDGDVRRVRVGEDYDVVVGWGLDAEVARAIDRRSTRVLVLHPHAVRDRARAVASAIRATGRTVVLESVRDREEAKTIEEAARLWDVAASAQIGRQDTIVAVGGGATTDLAGFVAAAWLRGVRLVNVPTTLLGMVDAAVGGKTGVNTPAGKNLVGAFHLPDAVVCDLDALTTLPVADLRAGLGEVVKCGFIADERILELLEADPAAALDPGSPVLHELVERTVAVKARVVGADLTEQGLREILNYGHTLAHAIEKAENFGVRHGEAVAVGMVFAAALAERTGHLAREDARRHGDVLQALGLPTTYAGAAWEVLREAMSHDKKRRGDDLRFVVLDAIGLPTLLVGPSEADLRAAFDRVSEEA